MFRVLTIEELAEDAFIKAERVKALQMMNTPTDYEERKKAFVELAKARKAASEAEAQMLAAINPPSTTGQHSTPNSPRTLYPLLGYPF